MPSCGSVGPALDRRNLDPDKKHPDPDKRYIDSHNKEIFLYKPFNNEGDQTFQNIAIFLQNYYKEKMPRGRFFCLYWTSAVRDNRISRYKVLKKRDYLESIFSYGGIIYEEGVVFEGTYFYPWVVIAFDENVHSKMFINAIGVRSISIIYTERKKFHDMMNEIINYVIKEKTLNTHTEKFLRISNKYKTYPIRISHRHDKYESSDDRYFLFARKV